jgi:phytoene dehydrogenase-like protein
VHSASAALAPEGGALIHAMEYLANDRKGDEAILESLLDRLQPGWRDVVVERRFLPSLTVSNALVTAAGGGLAGRPGPEVPSIAGLYVAGDWVGAEGNLADASLASAKRAAELAASRRVERIAA